MVDVKIRCKSTSSHTTLRNHIHRCIVQLHKRNRSGRFSIVCNGRSSVSQLSKITRSSTSDFRLHNHLSQFVRNSFDIIRNMNIETRYRQTTLCSHISPNWRRKTNPAFHNHLFESRLQFRFVKTFCRCSCNSVYGSFHSFSFQKVTSVKHLFRLFVEPPDIYIFVHHNFIILLLAISFWLFAVIIF